MSEPIRHVEAIGRIFNIVRTDKNVPAIDFKEICVTQKVFCVNIDALFPVFWDGYF